MCFHRIGYGSQPEPEPEPRQMWSWSRQGLFSATAASVAIAVMGESVGDHVEQGSQPPAVTAPVFAHLWHTENMPNRNPTMRGKTRGWVSVPPIAGDDEGNIYFLD